MELNRKMNNCGACAHRPESVPFIVHESAQARMERVTHRLWILAIILIVLLVGTNAAWLWYESQFESFSVTQDIDTGEGPLRYYNNLIGAGDINNGAYYDDGIDPAAETGW